MAENENTEETGTEQATGESTAPAEQSEKDGGKGAEKAILADLAKERRERQRLTRELETERAKGLSDAERAIAEAKAAGRAEALSESGKRLARAEIRAQAASAGIDASDLLDDLDLSRFIDDQGEPDDKAIAARVKRWAALAPQSSRPRGSADQGARGNGVPQDPREAFAALFQQK